MSSVKAFARVLLLAGILGVLSYITGDKLLTTGSLSFAVAFTALDRTFRTTTKEPAR